MRLSSIYLSFYIKNKSKNCHKVLMMRKKFSFLSQSFTETYFFRFQFEMDSRNLALVSVIGILSTQLFSMKPHYKFINFGLRFSLNLPPISFVKNWLPILIKKFLRFTFHSKMLFHFGSIQLCRRSSNI